MNTQPTQDQCPVCGEGQLSRPIAVQECDSCGSEVAATDLVAMNYRIQQAEKQRDELLAERDAIRVSLEKAEQRLVAYGEHRHHCPARVADSHHACICGLSAARVDARPVWGASKPATNTIPEAVAKARGDVEL